MVSRVHRIRIGRWPLLSLLLAAGWLVGVPMPAGAQPVADGATELVGRRDGVSNRVLAGDLESRHQEVGADSQTSTPASSASDAARRTKRDSVKNGLLIGPVSASSRADVAERLSEGPSRAALTIRLFALLIGSSPDSGSTRWRDIRDGTDSAQRGTAKRTTGRGGFITRHPMLFGALVGAAVGGGAAYAKWGAEGTWVGFWGGAAAGAGVGALVSR
jgi:hypothetical protein